MISDWIANNYIELFGAVTGIIYVIFEIRQIIWLWPLGILTSGIYIWVFFSSKFYADMSLQVYYLVISVLGWYWWLKGSGLRAQSSEQSKKGTEPEKSPLEGDQLSEHSPFESRSRDRRSQRGRGDVFIKTEDRRPEPEAISPPLKGGGGDVLLKVSHLQFKTGIILGIAFIILYLILWFVLSHYTDSPVPKWDSFLTSLSIIATWMLARKILEHWYLWIVVNSVSSFVFYIKGLYPTVGLYIIYLAMSFIGLREWLRSIRRILPPSP